MSMQNVKGGKKYETAYLAQAEPRIVCVRVWINEQLQRVSSKTRKTEREGAVRPALNADIHGEALLRLVTDL